MSEDFVRKALEAAADDYVRLLVKRSQLQFQMDELDRQEAKLSQKIFGLANLCNDEIPADSELANKLRRASTTGLTDAVRSVLKANSDWITPKQVRDQLIRMGVNLDKYQNPLASIHTVLGRLKEVEFTVLDEKKKTWGVRWKGSEDSLWTTLQRLPPDKVDEVIAKTAKQVVAKHMLGGIKSAAKRSRKKKE